MRNLYLTVVKPVGWKSSPPWQACGTYENNGFLFPLVPLIILKSLSTIQQNSIHYLCTLNVWLSEPVQKYRSNTLLWNKVPGNAYIKNLSKVLFLALISIFSSYPLAPGIPSLVKVNVVPVEKMVSLQLRHTFGMIDLYSQSLEDLSGNI